MPREPDSPSQDDVHAALTISLQASLKTAKEVIPVFISALTRTPLLRSWLSLLQLKLNELPNPYDLLALNTQALAKLSSRLQELLRQLHGLIDNDSSEDPKPLLTVTSGPVINLDRAAQDESQILESCELLQLAIDRAWPRSAAGIGDLIMDQDAATDQVEEVLREAKNANKVCGRLEKVYELLSTQLHGCKSSGHVAKFNLSGLDDGIIGFLFSRCGGTQGWHPMPCRIHQSVTPLLFNIQRPLTSYALSGKKHHQDHKNRSSNRPAMIPFRGCKDFRHAETLNKTLNKSLTLNLSKGQEILTGSVPKSELAREYGTVPEKFLTLKEVLGDNKSGETAKATIKAGWWYNSFMARLLQTPEQEPNDGELDYRSALTKNVATVQYLLSESVLHLYNSPWLLDIWQPDHIEFPKDGTLLDFKRPYYPSSLRVESSHESVSEQVDVLDPYDHAETFMAKFGLLILQLQLQQAFPLHTEDQSDDIWPLIALGHYYNDFKESIEPIKEVVDACLDFRRHLFEDLDAQEESDPFKFRIVFYKRILMPLRVILQLNFPDVAREVVSSTLLQGEHQETVDTQPRERPIPIGFNGISSKGASYPQVVGETMLKRPSPASSTEWFNNLDVLNEYLTAHPCESSENYDMSRVRIAVIDSGLREERQGDAYITYQNFIEKRNNAYTDNPQHGTNSVDLIRKVYGRADLYVAKVFQGDEADGNTSKYMAEAIKWAISKKVDIISISAGFKEECHDELEAQIKMATAGGAEPEILLFAAASNWQNISGVAYPASMTDRVIGIFCCNGGLKNSRQWNPNPRNHAANFAMLGEDVVLDSGVRLLGGTSVSTALAAGLAAKVLDFSRQPDVQSWMSKASREKMKTKAGMSAILKEMSRNSTSEGYECVAPWEILPARTVSGSASRRKVREAMCTIIEKAMKKA